MKKRIALLMTALLCLLAASALSDYAPVGVNTQERYNINLFLSNFSEQGMTFYSALRRSDAQLVDFAIFHTWYNRQDRIERGQWGNDNCRMSDQHVAEIAQRYFGVVPKDYMPTEIDYRDGYYYWQTTGGSMGMGFACLSHVEELGGGRYGVYFGCYGEWAYWSADDCDLRPEQAAQKFADFPVYPGYAVINTGGGTLADRSTWRLEQYDMLM